MIVCTRQRGVIKMQATLCIVHRVLLDTGRYEQVEWAMSTELSSDKLMEVARQAELRQYASIYEGGRLVVIHLGTCNNKEYLRSVYRRISSLVRQQPTT